jgi:arylsulfatase A-like enzyme
MHRSAPYRKGRPKHDRTAARAMAVRRGARLGRPIQNSVRVGDRTTVRAVGGSGDLLKHALLHVQCGGWTGFAIGALDAYLEGASAGTALLSRILVSGAAVGAALGVILGALLGALGVLSSRLEVRRDMPPAHVAGEAAPATARVVSFLLAGALALAVFAYALRASERIMVPSLRVTLLTFGAGMSIAIAMLTSVHLEPLVASWLSRASGHRPERAPASPALRFTVFGLVPTLLVAIPLIAIHGVQLGLLRQLLFLAGFVALERTGFLFFRSAKNGAVLRIGSASALAVSICAGAFLLRPGGRELQSIARGRILPDALSLLHRLTDVDRDGFSSLFGGRDCAAFARSRFPGARDVPANGLDEDCDGVDAVSGVSRREVLPKFSAHPPLGVGSFNVLWYIVDSLRADHLKLYGYGFETSPTLTALSAESWVFDRAYSQSSTTALSVPSMFSGRNPASMRWTRGTFPVATREEFYLSRAFSARGYLSGLAINDYVREHLPGIQHGFDRVLAAPAEVTWRSGDYVLSSVFQLVEQARSSGKPFFVVAHVDDVHHPYAAAAGKAVPEFKSTGEKAGYDAGVALFDQGLRAAVEHLRNVGVWERTVLIVTSDHGEEFGEHGGTVHSRTCYAEVVHVPLLLRIPRTAARRIAHRVALIDLAPTLLELLGMGTSPPPLDGQSLFIPAFESNVVDPERPIFCTICQVLVGRPPFYTRSVRSGRWSLFQDAKGGRTELYDLLKDPGERFDLGESGTHRSVAADLRQALSGELEGNLFRVSEGLE